MNTSVLSPAITDRLMYTPKEELNRILFLEEHPEYPTHYLVQGYDPSYIHDFRDEIGEYRAIFQFDVDKLRDKANELGYSEIVFMEDPSSVIERKEHLEDSYPCDLNVSLKRFQLQGFNYCKDLPSDIINWSTGTGKSVYAVAKAKYLLETDQIDRVVVVSKGHNKINWARTFEEIGGLHAEVAEATGNNAELRRSKRNEIYEKEQIFIINYEKLRFRPKKTSGVPVATGDGQELLAALKSSRVYFIWDEMPTRLKNQQTAAWKGAKRILGGTKSAYQSMLSATPLENSPEDIYACVKLLNPNTFGTLSSFRQRYAKSFNPFAKWQVQAWDLSKLREMGMRLAHMTHQANKYRDPEIAAEFPEEHWEDILIDLSDEDRSLYLSVEKELAAEYNLNPAENILPKLLVLQTICNNPKMLEQIDGELAQRIIDKKIVTDSHSAKIATLKEMLEQIDGKIVLFSMYNQIGTKWLAEKIQKWGYTYVIYDGNDTQMQSALDRFKSDPQIKIFISSDKGSDSINLEQATTVINYDLPWKYSTLLQRVNRINRITSDADHVWYFNLITAGTMEERKLIILEQKRQMQEAVEDPAAVNIEALTTLTAADYKFILLGE